ncbi:hypothetical protein E1B28_013809 [Marasmius oreades]|uniref:MARVEL domain-containing protein n=1 Tax=Marasmius oreades TaxID=181124 RepID=A0A9P7UPD7_9AGAR|nr:uncharacterized protein E1B28_013809 [Marasmius oreades]KAG7087871.1 hypothetical protein E1B28_013809 [Marasmius oreades]
MDLAILRLGLYVFLLLLSLILFSLSAARLQYTLHLPPGDPLNKGVNFYDPAIIELLVASLFSLGWCIFIIYLYFRTTGNPIIRTYREELVVLGILWLLLLGGSAAASNIWAVVAFCQQFQACQILSAVLGICWTAFVVLTAIIGVDVKLIRDHGGLNVPLARSRSLKESLGREGSEV